MTTNDEAPWEASLRECLAYAVLEDYESWLGVPSPHGLSVFLAGARTRADLARQPLSTWRLSGPLDEPDFYLPLVARTGHPQLAIKWATAMEMLHFSLADAMRELRDLMRTWARERGEPSKVDDRFRGPESTEDLFRSMATRPAMFIGGTSGWDLCCFLAGMTRGGDWLGLPEVAGIAEVVGRIEQRSLQSYGSRFAGYRVYDASELLVSWARIKKTK